MARKQSVLYKIFNFFDILPSTAKKHNLDEISYDKNEKILLTQPEFHQELKKQLHHNWNEVGQLIRYGMDKELNASKS